jgi:hypothetical protein
MKRLLFFLLCAVALRITATAHVIDQYLQAAQITLAPAGARVELRLTPGAQIADRVFALIDGDGNGQISPAEEQAYARRALQDISLEVDGRRAQLALTEVQFPSRREMNEGVGAIRLYLSAEAALTASGEHQLTFRNDHLPELGVYMANAMVPATEAIKITGLQRDALQHGLRVDFRSLPADARAWPRWTIILLIGLGLALLFLQCKRRESSARVESGTGLRSS